MTSIMTKKQKRKEYERLILPGGANPKELIKAIKTLRPLIDSNKYNYDLQSVFLHDLHESLPMLDGFIKILKQCK